MTFHYHRSRTFIGELLDQHGSESVESSSASHMLAQPPAKRAVRGKVARRHLNVNLRQERTSTLQPSPLHPTITHQLLASTIHHH